METQQQWSRRKVIATLAGVGTTLMVNPFLSWADDEVDPRIARIVAKTIAVDTHNHIDVPLSGELPYPSIDLAGDLKKSGLSAVCMTFAVDYQKLVNEGDGYNRFINGLNAMDAALKSNNIKRSLNLSDLQASHKKHKPTVIQSVEGGHFLEGKIERLEEAYKRGLRHLGLLHDNDASVPLGDIFTNPVKWGGLSPFGVEVIKECNRLGILIDLAHCTNDAVNAALKVTTKPIIISHTGLDTQLGSNANMAKMMKPRLISKEQAKIVADAGGVIGVWTHLADSPTEYAQNVRAMVDVVGIDHVCIGTDTKLTPSYRPPSPNQNKNEKPKPRIGERTNEAWKDQKTGFYYTVVDAMLKTGFSEDEIVKFGGSNFCRIFGVATANK
ncbi:MAG: membrane dipeptidase [Flectobacillus sp.]|nr:membrane dipeptidase [Flectobacillus sp.]